jgi:hypothetical protein
MYILYKFAAYKEMFKNVMQIYVLKNAAEPCYALLSEELFLCGISSSQKIWQLPRILL